MKICPILIACCVLVPWFAQKASGHDGWVEVNPIVEKGQSVIISLMLGNHANEHRSYRLAGKWDPRFTTLRVIDPAGRSIDLTQALIDFGEDEQKSGPTGPKGFYIAPFTPREEGAYTVLATEERILQHGDEPKFRSIRIARSNFVVLAVPSVKHAKGVKAFDGSPRLIDGLEIVPVRGAIGASEKDSVTLQVLYKGKPAAGKVVSIIRRMDGARSAQDILTGPAGNVIFTVGPADSYLTRIKFDEASERIQGSFDKSTYEATYVFQVFNRP